MGDIIRKHQYSELSKIFSNHLNLSVPKTETWNLHSFPIGVKKRLDEIAQYNADINDMLSIAEFQRIFERIMHDIKDNNQWNDLSLDMLLGTRGNMCSDQKQDDQPFSPPPEEIKLNMPDISALNIKDSSCNNSFMNESQTFNIDDILVHKHPKEGSNDKTVVDLKGRNNVNTFKLNTLTEKIVDINGYLKSRPNLDDHELQNVINLLKDVISVCEKSVQNAGLNNQKVQKRVILEDLKQKSRHLRKLIRGQV